MLYPALAIFSMVASCKLPLGRPNRRTRFLLFFFMPETVDINGSIAGRKKRQRTGAVQNLAELLAQSAKYRKFPVALLFASWRGKQLGLSLLNGNRRHQGANQFSPGRTRLQRFGAIGGGFLGKDDPSCGESP